MAGYLCSGSTENEHSPISVSRAYCEGMAYRASGTLLGAPKADNPHTQAELATAWDAGWDMAETATGGNLTAAQAGCCALIGAAVATT